MHNPKTGNRSKQCNGIVHNGLAFSVKKKTLKKTEYINANEKNLKNVQIKTSLQNKYYT